jgi:hypothetical protein
VTSVRVPRVASRIERRLLVNYRLDPDVVARLLPEPFRPDLVDGSAVAGICLIRLAAVRPPGLPARLGLRSENAAHRFAVVWDTPDGPRTGVYIPRRDTSSRLNVLVGGRLYPGVHHRARFDVTESDDALSVGFSALDGSANVRVAARVTQGEWRSRVFDDVEAASRFFEGGAVGWSDTASAGRYDGLRLRTAAWRVEPALVTEAHSSYFEDRDAFPAGSVELDCALLMREVPVVWESLPSLTTT